MAKNDARSVFDRDKMLIRVDSDPVEYYVDLFKIQVGLDLTRAIKCAASEYLRTPEGKEYLESTGGHFNYGDAIVEIPEDITVKHGYRHRAHISWDQVSVDQNEDLVPDDLATEGD